jgi:hypothetical protein
MRSCGSLATNVLGKAENVRSLTVSLLRITARCNGVARLRWSDEWNPLRMTEFQRLSDDPLYSVGSPMLDRHIPNLVRP